MQNRFTILLWSALIRLPQQTLGQLSADISNQLDSTAIAFIRLLDAGSASLFKYVWKTQDSIAVYVDDIQKYERWAEQLPALHPAISRR